MSTPRAGWYPDPDPQRGGRLRYWDGSGWVDAVAPGPLTPSASPTAARTTRRSRTALFVGLGVGVAIVLVAAGIAVGAALGRAPVPPPIATASPAPDQGEASDAEAPPDADAPPAEAPGTGFAVDAGKQLDDMDEDLDDLVTTVAEDGFWRLYSNAVELAFNLGQLEALTPPDASADAWRSALAAISTSLDDLDAAIETRDGTTILAAVDAVRAQVEAARAVALSAP